MSIYIDTITLLWATAVLIIYSQWAVRDPSWVSVPGFLATSLYLFAQTGWTVAFLSGDEWGREFSNYIWFGFNTLVFLTLTVSWLRAHRKIKKNKKR